jgi:hypothetical protein
MDSKESEHGEARLSYATEFCNSAAGNAMAAMGGLKGLHFALDICQWRTQLPAGSTWLVARDTGSVARWKDMPGPPYLPAFPAMMQT